MAPPQKQSDEFEALKRDRIADLKASIAYFQSSNEEGRERHVVDDLLRNLSPGAYRLAPGLAEGDGAMRCGKPPKEGTHPIVHNAAGPSPLD